MARRAPPRSLVRWHTENPSQDAGPKAAEPPARSADTVVYAWKDGREGSPEAARIKQLEIENLHLKQLVGNLSLEKKVLLERLAGGEPESARKRGGRDEA